MMQNLPVYLAFAVVLVIWGVLISLLTLLTPLRKLGQRSPKIRIAVICLSGALALTTSGIGLTYMGAEVSTVFYDLPAQPGEPTPLGEKRSIFVQELWLRNMAPPPWQHLCYTQNTEICARVEAYTNRGGTSYLAGLGLSALSALSSGLCVWLYTRKGKTEAQSVS